MRFIDFLLSDQFYAFMANLFWWAQTSPTLGTMALSLFSALVLIIFTTQFRQTMLNRLRNILLFTTNDGA